MSNVTYNATADWSETVPSTSTTYIWTAVLFVAVVATGFAWTMILVEKCKQWTYDAEEDADPEDLEAADAIVKQAEEKAKTVREKGKGTEMVEVPGVKIQLNRETISQGKARMTVRKMVGNEKPIEGDPTEKVEGEIREWAYQDGKGKIIEAATKKMRGLVETGKLNAETQVKLKWYRNFVAAGTLFPEDFEKSAFASPPKHPKEAADLDWHRELAQQETAYKGQPFYFQDPEGNGQGPYEPAKMRLWLEAGWFTPETKIRLNVQQPWKELRELYPNPASAFLHPPGEGPAPPAAATGAASFQARKDEEKPVDTPAAEGGAVTAEPQTIGKSDEDGSNPTAAPAAAPQGSMDAEKRQAPRAPGRGSVDTE